MQAFPTIKNIGMMINAGVKKLIDKGVCDKGSIWNPSNCECEFDKSCDTWKYFYTKKTVSAGKIWLINWWKNVLKILMT